MNKILLILPVLLIFSGCKTRETLPERVALAKVGETILYYDQVPKLIQPGMSEADSTVIVQNYITNWARKELLLLKAQDNLSAENKTEIDKQMSETRANLVIYQYQRQIMMEKMDTTITEQEMEAYYATNEKSFTLSSNIVKALFIKVPLDVPSLDKIRIWSRSSDQKDLQQLESTCYQFAEKFDDFNEEWVTMDKLSVELPQDIDNQDQFLKYNTAYETHDSTSVFLITFRDYRLRYSLAPYDYVRNDIKSIILNNRRFEFLQSLENGIYNEGLKANLFKLY